MKKIAYLFLILLLPLLLNNPSKADDLLPIKKIQPKMLVTYDFSNLENEDLVTASRSLPSSSVLVYNAFTADDDWRRDLDYYARFFRLKHAIHFCNITVKSTTVYIKWKVEGPQPWQSNLFKVLVSPKKCIIYYMESDYSNDGIYLFTGSVIPKGSGQNVLNIDTSKFRIY